jgi:hypothetical protein
MTARAQLFGKSFGLDLSARGYQVLFWPDGANHCPGCGHSQWYVGRITAECGHCGTALPLAQAAQAGLNPMGRKAVALHVIEGKSSPGQKQERRSNNRRPANGRIVALHIDGSPRAFALENISSGGVMGPALAGIGEASELVVELEDGTLIPAQLRWSDGTFAGLAFVTDSSINID